MEGGGRKGKKDLREGYVREGKEKKEGFELGVCKGGGEEKERRI